MRRGDVAEAILSLAASRERAAAMAGDFVEDTTMSGGQFWWLVARTAMAQAWRQLAASPRAVAGVAIRGMLAELGIVLAACVAYALLLLVAISVLRVGFTRDVPDWAVWGLAWLVSHLAVPFQVGWWMARRWPGQEGAGSLALAGLHSAIALAAGCVLGVAARSGATAHIDVILGLRIIYWDGADGSAFQSAAYHATVYPLLLLAGAAWFRLRSFQPCAPART